MSKVISFISFAAAVLTSLLAFADQVPVPVAIVVIIGSTLFGALNDGFSKALDHEAWTILGIVGTALGLVATVISTIPQLVGNPEAAKWSLCLAMISSALAAAGKTLRRIKTGKDDDDDPPSGTPRFATILILGLCIGCGALTQTACNKEVVLADLGLVANVAISEALTEVETRHAQGKLSDQDFTDLNFTLKQSQTAVDSVNAALDEVATINPSNKADIIRKLHHAVDKLDGVTTAVAKLGDRAFADKLAFSLKAGSLAFRKAEDVVSVLNKPTSPKQIKIKVPEAR